MDAMRSVGRVFDIQRFCVHDGPGIRTTVFLKGCPLSCQWCHNPEGIKPQPQIMFNAEKCISCKKCVDACMHGVHVFARERRLFHACKCVGCGSCAEICSADALTISGKHMSVDEVFQTVLRDKPFYGDDGGVTFSGGEVLLQGEFLLALLRRAKAERLHTAVDTSGYAAWQTLAATLEYTDLYLYDIKAHSAELHRRLTGVDNRKIMENLRHLDAVGARIWVRMPLVHGVNDLPKELRATAELLGGLRHVERVDLMPYHVLGRAKYGMLGLVPQAEFHTPSQAQMEEYRAMFRAYGINAVL